MKAKEYALMAGQQWAEYRMEGFVEPERKRVPKGQKIGFSRAKKLASLLMVLYRPSNGRNLRQIAKMAGTTEGVLKVWRTQKSFRVATLENLNLFSKRLIKGIESGEVSEGVAVYLNQIIQDQVAKHFLNLFKKNNDVGAWFKFYNMDKTQWEVEGRSLRTYYLQEENFERLNEIMDVALEGIILEENPKIRREHGEMVKQGISSMLKVLAGKISTRTGN